MAHGYNPDNREARGIRQRCRTVACPRCGALPGAKCFGVRMKRRSASHVERWQAFDPNSIGARAQRKEKAVRVPDAFDYELAQEQGDEPRQVRCNRCGSTDVRWRQQGGRWVLFSLQPGVEHACPARSASADEFEVV